MLGVGIAAGLGAPATAKTMRSEPLQDGRIARAKGDIVEAVLIGPTQRYEHFVLGSLHEAAGLSVTTADGRQLSLTLPADSVFEDREPRIFDLDGDGRNEVVMVRSRQSTGSSLAVLGLRDGDLKIIAETPPNGGPRRWLNPAGFGHFVATDAFQIAIVLMPHVVGRLEFWEFDGNKMVKRASLDGVSNHRIGSRNLHMSAVIARPGKTDLLVVPSLDRKELLAVEAKDGRAAVVGRVALPKAADGNLELRGEGAGRSIAVPLADGNTHIVTLTDLIDSRSRWGVVRDPDATDRDIAGHADNPYIRVMEMMLDISDHLLREAEEKAARDGTTLLALVEQGLRSVVAERTPKATGFKLRDASVGGGGLTDEFKNATPDQWLEAMYGEPPRFDRD